MKVLHKGTWKNGAELQVVRREDGLVTLMVNHGSPERPIWRETVPKYPPNWLRWLIDETASLAEELERRGPGALGKPPKLKKRQSRKGSSVAKPAPSLPASQPPSEKPKPEGGFPPRGAEGSGEPPAVQPTPARSSGYASAAIRRAKRKRPT